jgi:CheY-like chemotaxis protein
LAKILVVDGNVKIRMLTVRLLETRTDWQVIEATDGYDAIVKVSQLKPNMVVLDFAMSGLNGFETAIKIAAHFPKLPIILYTFYGIDGMKAEAQKHGISEVADKTASGDQLLATIEKYLGKAPSPSPLATEPVVSPSEKEEPQEIN